MLQVTFKTMALIGLCFLRKQTLLDLTDSNLWGSKKISRKQHDAHQEKDRIEHPSLGSPSSDHLSVHSAALDASISLMVDQMGVGQVCRNEEETVKVTGDKVTGTQTLRDLGTRGVTRVTVTSCF